MGTQYSQLTQTDRVTIQVLLQAEHSGRSIARQLHVHHSTICREIVRSKARPCDGAGSYLAAPAQRRSNARRACGGRARRKLGADLKTPLWKVVLEGLRCHWSPEQIAGKLVPCKDKAKTVTVNGVNGMGSVASVSHETIYCALYAMPRGTLRTELIGLLRKSHKTRLPRARGTTRKGILPNMTNIALRPPEVAARIVPGHWEGDLIKGSMNRSSVGTLVERTSRYVMLVKLNGGTAEHVLDGFKRRLKSIPQSLRQTMTYDQGSEMALHESLSASLDMDIFFCDPHSPWQRGSNENANGLIREFLPKGMDLNHVSHQQLASIEHALNNRPRKILGFKTPLEVFSEIKLQHIAGVALQA